MPSPERRVALRRMKLFAGGLLVFAAVVYVLCLTLTDGHGVWGYVQAMAEAAMVGGLADWFAVTALFRHPLGIPIPHTAIIPRKKDQIGESLAAFVQQNFLTAEVVGQRLDAARVPQRVGAWLADAAHAERVSREAAGRTVGSLAGMLNDDEIEAAVAGFVDKQVRNVDVAPALARIIDAVRDEGQHQAGVSTAERCSVMKFLDQNKQILRETARAPNRRSGVLVVDRRSHLRSSLQGPAVFPGRRDRHRGPRIAAAVRRLPRRLRPVAAHFDPARAAAVNQTKLQLLEHPEVRKWLGTLWQRLKNSILRDAEAPDSDLRRTIVTLTTRAGVALRDDAALQALVESGIGRTRGVCPRALLRRHRRTHLRHSGAVGRRRDGPATRAAGGTGPASSSGSTARSSVRSSGLLIHAPRPAQLRRAAPAPAAVRGSRRAPAARPARPGMPRACAPRPGRPAGG